MSPTGLPPLTDDVRGVVRNAGLMVMGLAVLMLVISLGGMLYMDIPLLLIGALLVGYSYVAQRKEDPAPPAAP